VAQKKVKEVKKWGMMHMGHAWMGGYGHKPPVTSMKLNSNNIPWQFSNMQGGLNLMMNPLPKEEK
jgi:hypothetical protein